MPARLAELAAAAGNDEADNGEPQALSLIKSVPGNISLESMLTEIAKLDAVRAAGLPDAAKASSHRPQATLVTQPKIAAPCEDGPGDTAERPFGFGRDGQPADPGVAPDRRVGARLSTWASRSWLAASRGYGPTDEPPTDRIFMHRRPRGQISAFAAMRDVRTTTGHRGRRPWRIPSTGL
jgi:hypothetical protein